MAVDPDVGSWSVRLIGMGSVSGLKSFLALVDWEGLGEGEDEIWSLQGEILWIGIWSWM